MEKKNGNEHKSDADSKPKDHATASDDHNKTPKKRRKVNHGVSLSLPGAPAVKARPTLLPLRNPCF